MLGALHLLSPGLLVRRSTAANAVALSVAVSAPSATAVPGAITAGAVAGAITVSATTPTRTPGVFSGAAVAGVVAVSASAAQSASGASGVGASAGAVRISPGTATGQAGAAVSSALPAVVSVAVSPASPQSTVRVDSPAPNVTVTAPSAMASASGTAATPGTITISAPAVTVEGGDTRTPIPEPQVARPSAGVRRTTRPRVFPVQEMIVSLFVDAGFEFSGTQRAADAPSLIPLASATADQDREDLLELAWLGVIDPLLLDGVDDEEVLLLTRTERRVT